MSQSQIQKKVQKPKRRVMVQKGIVTGYILVTSNANLRLNIRIASRSTDCEVDGCSETDPAVAKTSQVVKFDGRMIHDPYMRRAATNDVGMNLCTLLVGVGRRPRHHT